MPRKKNTEGEMRKPLLRFERVIYEKASFRLRQDVLQQIAEYVLYVKEVAGEEPTPDELVDRGMQRLFDADRGFHQWQQQQQSPSELKSSPETIPGTRPGTDPFLVSVPVRNTFPD